MGSNSDNPELERGLDSHNGRRVGSPEFLRYRGAGIIKQKSGREM